MFSGESHLQTPLDSSQRAARYHYAGRDIPTLLRQWAMERGDVVFIYWHPFSGSPRQWTYGEFWRDVQALAVGLGARGVGVGDRLLIHCDNCPEMLVAWYACATLGAIAVTTNTGASRAEMDHYLAKVAPVAAITQPQYAGLIGHYRGSLAWIAVTDTNSGEPVDAAQIPADLIPFSALSRIGATAAAREPDPLLPAGIMYTSGTTALPKAVVHSHGNVLWAGEIGTLNIDFRPADVMLVHFPLFHTNAQLWSVAVTLGVGGSCVLLPRVTVSRFWDVVTRYGVTHCSALALLVQGVAGQPVPPEHRLREVNVGYVSPDLEHRWRVRCPGMWGMSETVIHTLRTDMKREWPAYTLGRPTPGYEVMVADPETGQPCLAGESGELLVRGTPGIQLFLGYFRDREATARSFTEDGWFRTGDRVTLALDGNYYFQDRLKDVLKVGGENVSASEIEAVALQVDGVAEVAVVGYPDPLLDEVPVAFVILKPGTQKSHHLGEQIIAHCSGQLAKFKVPRKVWFELDFPRALLGKVAKNRLRELAIARDR